MLSYAVLSYEYIEGTTTTIARLTIKESDWFLNVLCSVVMILLTTVTFLPQIFTLHVLLVLLKNLASLGYNLDSLKAIIRNNLHLH